MQDDGDGEKVVKELGACMQMGMKMGVNVDRDGEVMELGYGYGK